MIIEDIYNWIKSPDRFFNKSEKAKEMAVRTAERKAEIEESIGGEIGGFGGGKAANFQIDKETGEKIWYGYINAKGSMVPKKYTDYGKISAQWSSMNQAGMLARGGFVSKSGSYLVGEMGPELVNLPGGSNVTPNHAMGNTIHVHVNGRVGASDSEIRDIAKKVGAMVSREINRTTSSAVRM